MQLVVLMLMVARSLAGSQHCCSPPAWEGYVYSGHAEGHFGTTLVQLGVARAHYDFHNKRAAFVHEIETLEPSGTSPVISYTVIDNYDTNKRVFVMGDRCTISRLEGELASPCISSDAEFIEESTLGVGQASLTTLRFREQTSQDDVSYFAVTKEGCIPTTYSSGTTGAAGYTHPMSSFGAFTGITPGIRDPSVFDVPAACTPREHFKLPDHAQWVENIFTRK